MNINSQHRLISIIAIGILLMIAAGVVWHYWPADSALPDSDQAIVEKGQLLYQTSCLSCHGDQQTKLILGQAPPHNGEGHTWHHPDADLKKWILEGMPNMPGFKQSLSEADVDAILVYIKTWWSPTQRATQARISKDYQEALDRQNR